MINPDCRFMIAIALPPIIKLYHGLSMVKLYDEGKSIRLQSKTLFAFIGPQIK